MNILVTNDDGWDAPGIEQLAMVASGIGSVTVVAPARPQSGVGHQLTMDRSMAFVERGASSYSLDGTPADCVRFGLHHLDQTFDLVLSGINHGANLGVDVFTSGTVAAAREANFHGIHAIALSQYRSNMGSRNFDWNRTAKWAQLLLSELVPTTENKSNASGPQLININLPDPPTDVGEMPEVIHCQTDQCSLPIEYTNTGGHVQFSGRYQDRPRTPGHDVDVCFQGKIAVSRSR